MPAKPILVYKLIKKGDSVPIFLQKKIIEQRQLLEIVQRIFPESLAGLITGCVRKDEELVILTESAPLASQLRFYSATILNTLKTHSTDQIISIKFRVIQPEKIDVLRRPTLHIPSPKIIQTLRGCSHFISDTGLKHSINRLADTLEKQHTHQSSANGVLSASTEQ